MKKYIVTFKCTKISQININPHLWKNTNKSKKKKSTDEKKLRTLYTERKAKKRFVNNKMFMDTDIHLHKNYVSGYLI